MEKNCWQIIVHAAVFTWAAVATISMGALIRSDIANRRKIDR